VSSLGDQLFDARLRGQVRADLLDADAGAAQAGRRRLEFGVLGRDHEVEAVVGELLRQFESDAAGRARHDGQRGGVVMRTPFDSMVLRRTAHQGRVHSSGCVDAGGCG
jgi:hypothetical protein